MKQLLFVFLLLGSWPAWAQFGPAKPVPPTLTFRAGNYNEVALLLTQAGLPIMPSPSLSISAEIRLTDVGRVLYTIPFSIGDTASGSLRAVLPELAVNSYKLGIVLKRTGQADFSSGIANLTVIPTGSLTTITSVNSMKVNINQVTQEPRVEMDASPATSIAAYYANQARLVLEQIQTTLAGGVTRVYALNAIPSSGFQLAHNRNTELVIGQCFRADTGQPDPLWRVRILNANTITLTGPLGEVFTGKVILDFKFFN